MSDITVSSDIHTFMQSATNSAARDNLGVGDSDAVNHASLTLTGNAEAVPGKDAPLPLRPVEPPAQEQETARGRAEHGEERRAPPEKLVPLPVAHLVALDAVVVSLVVRSIEVGRHRLVLRERHAGSRGPV